MEFLTLLLASLWLGILTSISPCPLATNIAAITYVSYRVASKRAILISGILYAIGRSLAYTAVGFLSVKALVSIPLLSDFLQRYINKILGPSLILVGIYLLGLFELKLPGISFSNRPQKLIEQSGIIGSLLLGFIFALAFCPVTAALFFGSLIPLTLKADSSFGLPFIFGFGTSVPVLLFAFIIMTGSHFLDRAYKGIAKVELYAKKITGVLFILIGIYFILSYIFNLF